ncbi:twin-arginine translocase subunit TatC [SAR202 cluster bacterium AC-647-N09_OGT_505m]|nr:twin-arginine translocase subunit TatC [SAR202 cluster bacterium AC-647-N09_OGT_505m]
MEDREIPLGGHLTELRRRIIVTTVSLVVGTAIAFAFHRVIFNLLMGPAQGFDSLQQQKLVFTQMTEMLGITMKVSLMGGLILASPIVLYQVVMFVAPGLTPKEKRYLFALLPGAMLSFVAGASFGYFVLLPPALNFLLTFGSGIAMPMIRVGNYINLVVALLFWLGVSFETPLVMFFLSKIGVVTPTALARQRRYALVVAFILGALITPTFDPVNQTLVAVPIILLYELGIWLARLARLGRKKPLVDSAI